MTIVVMFRSNAGQDNTSEFPEVAAAVSAAKTYRNPGNHLVAVEVGGERLHRWDRDPVVGGNHWRKVSVDSFEVLGAVCEIRQGLRVCDE